MGAVEILSRLEVLANAMVTFTFPLTVQKPGSGCHSEPAMPVSPALAMDVLGHSRKP